MRPRTPFESSASAADEECCRTRELIRESIRVSKSTSLIAGSVKSRTSNVVGRIDGKYRWKKIRLRTPKTEKLSQKEDRNFNIA